VHAYLVDHGVVEREHGDELRYRTDLRERFVPVGLRHQREHVLVGDAEPGECVSGVHPYLVDDGVVEREHRDKLRDGSDLRERFVPL
jgi:hypothetical protein